MPASISEALSYFPRCCGGLWPFPLPKRSLIPQAVAPVAAACGGPCPPPPPKRSLISHAVAAACARLHLQSAFLIPKLLRPWPSACGASRALPYPPTLCSAPSNHTGPYTPVKACTHWSQTGTFYRVDKTRRRACPRRVLAFSYAFLAISTSFANTAASFTARSASTLRFRSIPAFLRPLMKRE